MDESNSFMDQSSYADPNKPVLRAILHTQQNKQFLEHVNGRQKASVKAAKILCCNSDGLKVLMEKFEQSVYNGTPLGQIKMKTHNLIGSGSLEVVELLQIPFNRPDSKEETGTATHLPPDQPSLLEDSDYEPPENEIEGYVDDYVQNCNDADEWEPVAVVQRTKKVVFKDCIMPSKSKKFAGNTEVRTSDHASNLVVQDTKIEPLGAPQLSDQEPPQHVAKQALDDASDQKDLISEESAAEHNTSLTMELEERVSEQTDNVIVEEQDMIEDGVQPEATSAPTNYDDLLTRSIEEYVNAKWAKSRFYRRVPWMYYIVSEVKARRRWKSMSDLDEFKKKKEVETEKKAKEEEDARIAEEQRVLTAQRIEAREKDRNYMYMILKIDLMFQALIITVKGSPPLPPALTEFTEYLLRQHKGGGGGLSVDVNQYLYKQVRSNQNSSDPELLTFYKRLLELKLKEVNTSSINCFVSFSSLQRGGGFQTAIEHQQLPKAKEDEPNVVKTKVINLKLEIDCLFENKGNKAYISNFIIDEYLKQLAENNSEGYVFPSGCFQAYDASKIREFIEDSLKKKYVKFTVFAICYQEHWRILRIDPKAIYEYDALNLPIPARIMSVIAELRKSKSLDFQRLSEDPSKPKQSDGHNCGLFVIGQAIEWFSNKPWRAETLPRMPEFRMDVLEKLMATCLCTLNNCPVTISTVFAHRQQMNMNRGSSVCSFEQKKMNSRDAPLSQHIDQLYNTNAPDEMHTNERSSHQRKRTSSDAREHVETKIVTSSTPTKRGCEIDLEIRDISILISAENGNGLRVKIREPNSSANTKSEGICDFHENSMKWTSGDAGTQSSSKRDVVFHPEYVDQFNNSNALTLPQSPILQANAVSSPPKKINSSEIEAPAAKKSKIETVFVIHGLFQRNRPIDNRPFIEFLSSQGFKINSECDILPNVSLPTRQPKPKFLANFSAVGQTKEDLFNWLNEESTIVHFYSGNREQFGSDACKYLIIAKCEGVGYARITQFMLHLMDRCVCLNTLDVFRSICTMDYDGLKVILLATSQHDLQQTLQKFSVCGRKEIKFACKQFMDIQRSFWLDSTSSKSAAETEETDAPQLS